MLSSKLCRLRKRSAGENLHSAAEETATDKLRVTARTFCIVTLFSPRTKLPRLIFLAMDHWPEIGAAKPVTEVSRL
jgi:hypothetical protein